MRDLKGLAGTDPLPEYTSLMDNLVLLRQAGLHGELRRFIGVVKMRDSAFDTAFHDVTIGPGGLQVANRLIMPGDAGDREPQPQALSKSQSGAVYFYVCLATWEIVKRCTQRVSY
ncbi:hypothetical protein [Cupriavidus oxalaticus]|uniref:Uncharacterized protein n=1 Tax=Cupriavidus oxalaticus TaxID=96344 RepID=A0A4P7LSA0_9BURK|nr:hypothetical protein [Cupriavidus oxalaticus]QBY55371.1 hypothetical protein E0W60_30395 [Cupriavidus oxalaticus]